MAYRHIPAPIKQAIRDKSIADGGYPLFIILSDGEALCPNCARTEYRQLVSAYQNPHDDSGWRPVAAGINWRDTGLYCAHCGEQIKSAGTPDR